jgi:hypothetical protein
VLEKRFRDWGTLRYLFRGIAENMPFVRKVHLVVSHESQVPEWVNREEVHIVLHKDIIPAEFLPTFNSWQASCSEITFAEKATLSLYLRNIATERR